MTTTLGNRSTAAPLPTGIGWRKRGAGAAAVAWPPNDWHFMSGDGGAAQTPTFNRPERFLLRVGMNLIAAVTVAAWTRYDYKLRLLADGAAVNDLNGIHYFQKCTSGTNWTDPWYGFSIEALFYCEANTNYVVQGLSGGATNANYYQASGHWNMWAYTIGEGMY